MTTCKFIYIIDKVTAIKDIKMERRERFWQETSCWNL